MSSNSPAPLFTNSTAAGPSSAAQFDPAAQEQTVTTLLLVLILGPLPPILLVACCALARHCLRKLRRKWAKRRARGGSRSRSPLGRRARRNSGSLTPLTNRSTTYADLELSSPRESDAGSAASVEAAYAALEAASRGDDALAAEIVSVGVFEASQRRREALLAQNVTKHWIAAEHNHNNLYTTHRRLFSRRRLFRTCSAFRRRNAAARARRSLSDRGRRA